MEKKIIGKEQFTDKMAEGFNISKIEAKRAYDMVFKTMEESFRDLKDKEQITVKGLGKFVAKQKAPYDSVSAFTGEKIKVKGRKAISFTLSGVLKEEFKED